MSAVLRASGANFDVDGFLAASPLTPYAIYRRGEAMLPATRPNGRTHSASGVHVVVSDAGFDKFPRQVEEAIRFLREHREAIRELASFAGVEGVVIDFGVLRRDVAVQTDSLPAAMIRLAGELGLGIEMSQYPES